jgi:hypothetical protein
VSHWFDARAAKTRAPSAERRRKIGLIEDALGKSDRHVHTYLLAIQGDARSLRKFGPDPAFKVGVAPVELRYFVKLRDELLSARDRLAALHTGLQAERELSRALTESAAAVNQWHRGMSTNDSATINHAQTSMEHHFATAERHAKAGLAALKVGR